MPHHLAQSRLAQRRPIDLRCTLKSGSSFCSSPRKSERMLISMLRRRVGYTLRNQLRESSALALLGAYVKLLPLIDVEQERRRLGLMQRVAVKRLRRIEQVPQCDLAGRYQHRYVALYVMTVVPRM